MPIYKTKDENFFKKWTSEMAYVLGFIAADGSLIKNKRGACFIEIQSIDKEIIYKIKKVLHTNLKIGAYQSKHINYKKRYRLYGSNYLRLRYSLIASSAEFALMVIIQSGWIFIVIFSESFSLVSAGSPAKKKL